MSLQGLVKGWRPAPVSTTDMLSPRRATELAATLDLVDVPTGDGDPLPPMWHWVYFGEWPRTADLGEDGHARIGSLLPPIPHRRRMFAGARITFDEPLILGRPANRVARVVATTVKHGKTGELVFVTVRSEFIQDGSTRMSEEQDVVYRTTGGPTGASMRVTNSAIAPASAEWVEEPVTTPMLLFRFSALTSNAHRIHYDQQYATAVEGFPDLVVHGPLLAVYMSELLRVHCARPVSKFAFRLRRPVFVGDAIRVEGVSNHDGSAALKITSGSEDIHATASVFFR